VIELDHSVVGPKLPADFLAQHHLARALQQHAQNLERLVLKPDPGAAFAQLARAHIQFERTKPEDDSRGPSGASSFFHAEIPITNRGSQYIIRSRGPDRNR
jgi:hypothetical protein